MKKLTPEERAIRAAERENTRRTYIIEQASTYAKDRIVEGWKKHEIFLFAESLKDVANRLN